MTARRGDPSSLSLEEASERFLARKRGGLADATVREYGYRLRRLREWCDEEGIETVGELHPLDFDDYLAHRLENGVSRVTVKDQFKTVRSFIEFLETLGAVQEGLHEAVPKPDVPDGAKISEAKLAPEQGTELIRFYRGSPAHYAASGHLLLEIIWHTGARMGSLRALDLDDYLQERQALAFRHRPDTETPLKNGPDGERILALESPVADVVSTYVDERRHEVRDDHGRRPLITTTYGRPSPTTIRNWTYQATLPCVRADCPHGKSRPTCGWTQQNHASKCPSSRSPHAVRTGAITRMLHRIPREKVEYRTNTSAFAHYDHASELERLEQRDRDAAAGLALDTEDDDA